MTDTTKPDADAMDDLELVISWLNGQLDPERAEAVRRRLEEDAAFREFAAPLLLAWSVRPRHEREPRPEGEQEREWERFVRRTGFPHRGPDGSPRRRRWVMPLVWVVLLTLGTLLFTYRHELDLALADTEPRERFDDFDRVPSDTGWIPLGDSIFVQLTPGASLRVRRQWDTTFDKSRAVLLDGTARFVVHPLDAASPTPRPTALRVHTRAGRIEAGEADFTVTARADTTQVALLPTRRALLLGSLQHSVTATVPFDTTWAYRRTFAGTSHSIPVLAPYGATIVRGVVPSIDPRNRLPRRTP